MSFGIVIPCDENRPLAVEDFESHEDYAAAVGGLIEAIAAGEDGLSFFVNEEGKLIGLPFNRRATILWHVLVSPCRPHDALNGDVVLVGPASANGTTLDVPRKWEQLLFTAVTFAVQVRHRDAPEWEPMPHRFSDYFAAGMWGLALANTQSALHVRVVADT